MVDIKQVADSADIIVNGYAYTRTDGNIRVLNLKNTKKAALINKDGETLETSMDNKMNTKLVMFFTKDINKSEKISNLCKGLDIQIRKLVPADVNKEVGSLASIKTIGIKKEKSKAPVGYNMPEVMIFSGISEEYLDLFLAQYKKENIESIALKAVLTPYNISWTLYELITELQRERFAMMFGEKRG